MKESEPEAVSYEDELRIKSCAYDLLNSQTDSMSESHRQIFAAAALAWGINCADELGRAVARGILEALDSEVSK